MVTTDRDILIRACRIFWPCAVLRRSRRRALKSLGQAKPNQCNQDTICIVGSMTGIFYSHQSAPPALYNQCGNDADCTVFTGNSLAPGPNGKICCDNYDTWANATCSGVNQTRLAGQLKQGCGVRPACISQASPVPPPTAAAAIASDHSCPAPPRERCCSRVMSNPAATLRVNLKDDAVLTSLTVWAADSAAGPLVVSDAQLVGAGVSIGSNLSMTGCAILPARADSGLPGYEARPLMCGGATGPLLVLSFPNALAGGRQGRVAVKVCTVAATDASLARGEPATVWVQRG